ncbi:MAG: discoidin domain-containing protein, partial [Clostridia bacterium]|nr:discoidin domain-containing protein [Clostridia bacterium]
MKHFTRALSLLLALLMCAGIFAACTKTAPTTDEPSENASPIPSGSVEDPETPTTPPPTESKEEVDVDIGPTTNVALGKPAYANGGNDNAANVTDGSAGTYWTSREIPKYVEVDLQKNHTIKKVVVKIPKGAGQVAFNVYGSLDGVNFDRLGAITQPILPATKGEEFYFKTPRNYRVIRVMTTYSGKGSSATSTVSEIEVHGIENDTEVTPTRTEIKFPSYEEWLKTNHGFDVSTIKDQNGKYDIEDTYTEADTIKALEGLVTRVLGEKYVSWFTFDVEDDGDPKKDYYEISMKDGKVLIKGDNGV